MRSNLLITKIIVPTRRTDVLSRPRLLDFIHEYIERKLLLLSASAGYGKTSLLVDFAHDTDLKVCWYSLDEGDRDPQIFLEYLVAAIQRQFPHFGGRTIALLQGVDDTRSLDACIGALVTEIHEQIDSFFVLVIDDYHLVETSAPVNQLLDRLLYYLPENAHLVLASRTIPSQLTLTRLTAQLQVAGLGVGDLRFTPEEIRTLIQKNYGMEITPTMADEVAAQSEGWITGIVLTTPTMWRGLFHQWVKGYGPGSQLFDYLATEVMAQQSPLLQQFLLETALLPELDAASCDELLGRTDAQLFLQLAEKRNLFLTRLDTQGFRYHHLFREFLQSRLRQTQPARYNDVLRQTAALLERRGKMDQAIEQWFAADEPANAARLIEIVAEEYYKLGRWATLKRWLERLPDPVLQNAPLLWLWRAILDAEMGEMEAAQLLFANAIAEFERQSETLNLARALIESARFEPNLETAVARCERALEQLPAHEYLFHAMAYRVLGVQKARHGDYVGAIEYLESAVKRYELANQRYLQAEAEIDLGNAHLVVGERAQAMARFENARVYWQRAHNSVKLANALNSIAVTRYQQGELNLARELLQDALMHARQSGNLRIEAYILASLGDIDRDQGKLAKALQLYTDASSIAEKIREHFLITYARAAVGDVWRLAGDMHAAEQVLQTALQTAAAHRSDYEVALVQVEFAALRLAQNEPEAAIRHLEHALPLLERTDAKRDIGHAFYYFAQAALLRKREAEALRYLRSLAALGKELDEDQFLVSQAANARHVVEFALTRRVGVPFFKRLAKKLEQAKPASALLFALQDSLPQLELRTFGEAQVLMDGTAVPRGVWQTTTTKELFFFFATNPQGWRKEQIFEALWNSASRAQANDLFHASMYRIRRALFAECILFRHGLYQLNPEAVRWLDVREFEEEIAAASRTTAPRERIEHLERATALYHGDFLEEFYSDWCQARRGTLRDTFLNSLADLGRAWFQLEDSKRAMELYQQILQHEPTREETFRDLIELHWAAGNRAGAIQTYQQCVKVLDAELGLPPMPETVALYKRLLREA